MAKVNKSRYAILGMLSLGPKAGYDIKKMTEVSIAHFWHESFGQIYPNLRQLEKEMLVTSRLEPQTGARDRRVYTLTDEGEQLFKAWLREPVEYAPPRNELLLKLFFGDQLPVENVRSKIRAFRREQRARLETYDGLVTWLRHEFAEHPSLPFWLMTLNYGQHHTRALLAWAAESLEGLEHLPSLTTLDEMPNAPLEDVPAELNLDEETDAEADKEEADKEVPAKA